MGVYSSARAVDYLAACLMGINSNLFTPYYMICAPFLIFHFQRLPVAYLIIPELLLERK